LIEETKMNLQTTTNDNSSTAIKSGLIVLMIPALVMWIVEGADQLLFQGSLDQSGIHPRTAEGLLGIFYSPFLHAGFMHLVANTVPFLVLGGFVMLRGIGRFVAVSFIVLILGGFGTWLIGKSDTVHVGASGVIFGYLGYLIGAAVFERSFVAIVLALIGGGLYGGILFGVLPGQIGISWEGHLFGFVGGVVAAKLFTRKTVQIQKQ
jgi:membrane associated rhomboid family serine protease